MNYKNKLLYNLNKDISFSFKPTYILRLNENAAYVPKITLKNPDIFPDFPANTALRYTPELLLKAIKFGMVIRFDYKGKEDTNQGGHERTMLPLVIGKSKEGKVLIRCYQLNGYSVSKGTYVSKEFRMFRADRILNIVFLGGLMRLAPDGYKENDKGIQNIIKSADFNEIRKNITSLLDAERIDAVDHLIIQRPQTIIAKDLNYNLKIFNPFADNIIPKKDANNIRVTFAKPITGNAPTVIIIGTSIEVGKTFKLNDLDTKYTSIKYCMANEIELLKNINNLVEFKAYLFTSEK